MSFCSLLNAGTAHGMDQKAFNLNEFKETRAGLRMRTTIIGSPLLSSQNWKLSLAIFDTLWFNMTANSIGRRQKRTIIIVF